MSDREYEPNLEDDRVVDIDDEADVPTPPPTIDPEERIEEGENDAQQADV